MKKFFLGLHVFLIGAYTFLTFTSQDPLVLGGFSFLCNLVSGVSVLYFGKHLPNIKKEAKLLSAGILVWTAADFFWCLEHINVFGYEEVFKVLTSLYELTDVFFAVMIVFYFLNRTKKWHKYELRLGAIFAGFSIFLVFYSMGSEFFFSKNFPIFNTVINFIFLTSNTIILVLLFILIVSNRENHLNDFAKGLIGGLLLFVTLELVYSYSIISGKIENNSVIDLFYAFIFTGFSLLILYFQKLEKKDRTEKKILKKSDRGKRPRIIWIFPVIMGILFYFKRIDIQFILVISIVFLIYILFSKYLQNLLLSEQLLKKEKRITQNLESIVKMRTEALIRVNKKLKDQAEKDGLTGLYNRACFFNQVKENVQKKQPFTILYMDINRFKPINDVYGHTVGDHVIREMAKRFINNDCEICTTARLGGDEFGVIISTVDLEEVSQYSKKIISLVEEPFTYEEFSFQLSISIGAARYPLDASGANELVKYADMAMYSAKRSGHTENVFSHHESVFEKIERRNQIEWQLKKKDYKNEFTLYYQPQFEIETGKLIGMEALLRWNNKELGMVSPAEFIPIAEETNRIVDITNWVINKAVTQINKWNEIYKTNLVMGVNISPILFHAVEFIPRLKMDVDTGKIKPQWIDFEVTEHSAISAVENAVGIFDNLKALGFSVSIDDFGTGYSSLSYLKRFSISRIKIAKELIDNIVTSNEEKIITQSIVTIAKGIGLGVIAEGVETKKQFEILKELGCGFIQGYLWGYPVPAKDFEKNFLNKNIKNKEEGF